MALRTLFVGDRLESERGRRTHKATSEYVKLLTERSGNKGKLAVLSSLQGVETHRRQVMIATAPWTFSARLPCPWWRPQWPPSPILSCRGGFSFARELSSALRAVVGNMFMRVVGFAGSKDMLTTRDTMWLELHNMFAVR